MLRHRVWSNERLHLWPQSYQLNYSITYSTFQHLNNCFHICNHTRIHVKQMYPIVCPVNPLPSFCGPSTSWKPPPCRHIVFSSSFAISFTLLSSHSYPTLLSACMAQDWYIGAINVMLLLIICLDGALVCLNTLIFGGGGSQSRAYEGGGVVITRITMKKGEMINRLNEKMVTPMSITTLSFIPMYK